MTYRNQYNKRDGEQADMPLHTEQSPGYFKMGRPQHSQMSPSTISTDHGSLSMIIITLFGGIIGIHRYLRGEIGKGVVYTLTGGLFGIGWIIDLIKEIAAYHPASRPNLLEWQQLVTHNYTEQLYMTQEQLEQATYTIIEGNLKILKECMETMNTTLNPRTFFDKFDRAQQMLNEAAMFEKFGIFSDNLPSNAARSLICGKLELEKNFIDGSFCKVLAGKNHEKIDRYFTDMALFQKRMEPESYDYLLKQKYNSYIAE